MVKSYGGEQYHSGNPTNTFNTIASDINPSIAIDPNNNIVVAYCTQGATPGNTRTGDQDIVVFKLDENGSTIWVKQNSSFNGSVNLPMSVNNTFPSIACDSVGNICVSYWSDNSIIPGGTPNNGNTIVVFKLDSNGNTLWAKQDATINLPSGTDNNTNIMPHIAVDSEDNINVSFTVEIPGGSSTHTAAFFRIDSTGRTQYFIHKYNNTWLNASGPSDTNQQAVIAINGGSPYIAYVSRGVIQTGTPTGENDIIVLTIGEITNSFCSIVGGGTLLTRGATTLVYTKETIDALMSGATLPTPPVVSWALIGLPKGSLLRDLGRSIDYSKNGAHIYVFRSVQYVNGPTTEGVGGSPTDSDAYQSGWICTWSSYGYPVLFI